MPYKQTTHTLDISTLVNAELAHLRTLFMAAGFDIQFVGGCVRDFLVGYTPKDIDLCTDANPTEQIEIYQAANIRYIETGLQHGTVSVVLNNITYEITSLRQDATTDGRHATVVYTRDWYTDLDRRDFTINAMSLTFNGELIDPFNGLDDLHNGLVVFVGNAEQRIQEDYLRILRWFRFRGRFGMSMSYSARRAIEKHATGLVSISRERVWSEISKILSGNNGPYIVIEMKSLGIYPNINLGDLHGDILASQTTHAITRNPVTLLVSLFHDEAWKILENWKASRYEQDLARWLAAEEVSSISPYNWMAVSGISREWAMELAALRGMDGFDRAVLAEWEVPMFPVSGNDIIALGVGQGPKVGKILSDLKLFWAHNNYVPTKQDLLNTVNI